MKTCVRYTPLVSVVVPTLNYGQFISESLLSLQNQSYSNWECMVVDDGSTDDTGEIVKRFMKSDSRIRYVYQKNSGQAVARNVALNLIKGKYIQFLDADDRIEFHKLCKQVTFLEEHSTIDVVYSAARYFTTEDPAARRYSLSNTDEAWMPQISGNGMGLLPEVIRSNIMPINAALIRVKVFDRVGVFEASLTPVEDWDFFIRCCAAGMNFAFFESADTLALIRYHANSATMNRLQNYGAVLRLRKKIAAKFSDSELRQINRERTVHIRTFLAHEELKNGNRLGAFQQLLRAAWISNRILWTIKRLGLAVMLPFVSRAGFEKLLAYGRAPRVS